MRLIDADAIPFRREIGDLSERPKMFVSKNTVDHLPTIDPASLRPKGEWVQVICHVEFEDGFVDRLYECCSKCHKPNGRRTSDFCPNCGADMRGESDAP